MGGMHLGRMVACVVSEGQTLSRSGRAPARGSAASLMLEEKLEVSGKWGAPTFP